MASVGLYDKVKASIEAEIANKPEAFPLAERAKGKGSGEASQRFRLSRWDDIQSIQRGKRAIYGGDTAVDEYLGFTFIDTLSLVKVDDTWVIYNKLFHKEAGH